MFYQILIEHFDSGDVVAFALCFRSNRVSLFDRGDTPPQIGRRGRRPYWMVKAHGDAPVRHRATPIHTDYVRECRFRFVVPERVKQGDTALEGLLRLRGARYRKIYLPEIVMMAGGIALRSCRRCN